jgi:hypothetical protein
MQMQPTAHPEIMRVTGPLHASVAVDLDDLLRRLEDAAERGHTAMIDAILQELVPGFKPTGRPARTPTVEASVPLRILKT